MVGRLIYNLNLPRVMRDNSDTATQEGAFSIGTMIYWIEYLSNKRFILLNLWCMLDVAMWKFLPVADKIQWIYTCMIIYNSKWMRSESAKLYCIINITTTYNG